MNTYRVTMKAKSTMTDFADSQTLFGAFCWAIRDLYGSERLEKILDNFLDCEDTFILSSTFPKGLFPKPIINFTDNEVIDKFRVIDYKLTSPVIKKLNKIRYISEEVFKDFITGRFDAGKIIIDLALKKGVYILENDFLCKTSENIKLQRIKVINDMRNNLNRLTNSTEEGNLFYHKRIYIEKDAEFNFYVKTKNEVMINSILKYLSDSALLGDKSTGMNVYEFSNPEDAGDLFAESKIEKSYLLSKYIPQNGDIDWSKKNNYQLVSLNYRVESREEFLTEDNVKKQVVYMTEGSLIHLNNRERINGCLPVIKEIGRSKIYQNGLGFFV